MKVEEVGEAASFQKSLVTPHNLYFSSVKTSVTPCQPRRVIRKARKRRSPGELARRRFTPVLLPVQPDTLHPIHTRARCTKTGVWEPGRRTCPKKVRLEQQRVFRRGWREGGLGQQRLGARLMEDAIGTKGACGSIQ
jgi:hypothetical protein